MQVSVETTSGLERKLTVASQQPRSTASRQETRRSIQKRSLAGLSPRKGTHECHEAAFRARYPSRGIG